MELPEVTTLIATRRRPQLLQRAIESVLAQDYHGKIFLNILIDDCSETADILTSNFSEHSTISWNMRTRKNEESSGPAQLARLRNELVSTCNTKWLHFLDDDVTFAPNHTSSLVKHALLHDCDAVHSWMRVFHRNGTPYLETRWPWCRDPDIGFKKYEAYVCRGVVSRNCNIIRDSIHNLPGRCVDANEWLLPTELVRVNPIPTEFTFSDWQNNKSEDDKLLINLLSLELKIECTMLPTVNYYLGGFSNDHQRFSKNTDPWLWAESNHC